MPRVWLRIYCAWSASRRALFVSVFLKRTGEGSTNTWLVSNVALKMWGNHNQETRDNSSVGYYLFVYGMFALASAVFAFVASVLLWVFCAIKSARSLHDAVRTSLFPVSLKLTVVIDALGGRPRAIVVF